MLGWAGRMVIDCADRTVPGWDLGGSLDRSWIRLLNRSRAAAEGTVADCRTRHRIAVGFGMAVGVDHVAEGSFRLEGRVDCHCIAGTGGHGNIAGTAGRWIHDTIEHGLAARCRMMTVGSLAVASDHIPAGREFHGFHIAEAARRTSVAVAVVVAVGSNPGSSRSCCPRQRGLVVDIGSWFRFADCEDFTAWRPRNEIGLKTGRDEEDIPNKSAIRLIVAAYLELRWDPSRRHSHSDRSDSWTNVGDVCSAHRFFTASAFTSSQPHRDRPLGKEQNKNQASQACC